MSLACRVQWSWVDRTGDTVKQSQRRVTSPTYKMFRQHLKCSLTAPRRAGTSFGFFFLFLFTQPAVWPGRLGTALSGPASRLASAMTFSGCDTSPTVAIDCCSFSIWRTQSPEELGRVGERSLGWTARLPCGDTDFFFFNAYAEERTRREGRQNSMNGCHGRITSHDVLKKSAKKIGLLRRLGRQLSSTVVRDLYAFSIRPGIEYGSIVWSGLSSSDAARLERLNRSAARLITKTSPSSDLSRELLLARAGLPSLGTRRRMAQCTLIRKAYLGRHPRHLQRALSPWISPGKRRQSPRTSPLSILVQRPNKSFFQRSPLFQAATTWNRFVAATASRDLPSARDIANFFEH